MGHRFKIEPQNSTSNNEDFRDELDELRNSDVPFKEAYVQEEVQQHIKKHGYPTDEIKDFTRASVYEVSPSEKSDVGVNEERNSQNSKWYKRFENWCIKILKPVELPKLPSSFAPNEAYTNRDTDPVPPEEWTWNRTTVLLFWCSDLLSAGTWSTASSFTSYRMTWWQQLLAIYLGAQLISIVIALNGLIGSRLHTGFAINVRASYGYYLSKFVIISRLVIAYFWLSINTYQGGIGVTQMLIAIWPSYRHFKNRLSPSSGVTSQEMLSFFILWFLQMPLCWIHPRRLRPVFLAKAIAVPMVAVATMGWTIHYVGPTVANRVMGDKNPLEGLQGWYQFMSAAMSIMGIWSTMACNIADFTRYCRFESAVILQMFFVPVVFVIVCIFGTVTGNLLLGATGEDLFQPFDVYNLWQDTHGGRAAAFICSFAWVVGAIGTNITANSVSAANDLATLIPRYINIRRGQVIACVVGVWAFAPWKILQSASSFVTFMSTYSIVLVPIAVIMITDFLVVQKGSYDIFQLYEPHGIYRHRYGVNWRALVALILSVTPNLPGMAKSLNSSQVHIGNLKYLFCINDIYGIIVSSGTYILLNMFFPHKPTVEYREKNKETMNQHVFSSTADEESLPQSSSSSHKEKNHSLQSSSTPVNKATSTDEHH